MFVLKVRGLVDKAETLHGITCWCRIGTLTPPRHISVASIEQYDVDKHAGSCYPGHHQVRQNDLRVRC